MKDLKLFLTMLLLGVSGYTMTGLLADDKTKKKEKVEEVYSKTDPDDNGTSEVEEEETGEEGGN